MLFLENFWTCSLFRKLEFTDLLTCFSDGDVIDKFSFANYILEVRMKLVVGSGVETAVKLSITTLFGQSQVCSITEIISLALVRLNFPSDIDRKSNK